MGVGLIQSFEDPTRTKRWKKDEFALCLIWDICLLLPSDRRHPRSWLLGFWTWIGTWIGKDGTFSRER